MGIYVEPQLPVVRGILAHRIPTNRFRVRFRNQVIRAFQRPHVVAYARRNLSIKSILRVVIRIRGGNVQSPRDVQLIDLRPRRSCKIMHNKLVRSLVFVDNGGLPCQKVRRQPLLVTLPLQFPPRINDPVARRELGPIIQALAPVVQPPNLVQLIYRFEFDLQIFLKAHLHIVIRHSG